MTNDNNHIRLQTERLMLIPLSYEQLIQYATPDNTLAADLGITLNPREFKEDFKQTMETYLIPYIRENPHHVLYATIWLIVDKEKNIAVGDVGFNSGPTEKGVLEMGYCTYPDFLNQGYMSEALAAISSWAFEQPEVQIIISQTDKHNYPAQKVLMKNNYVPFADADNFFWWRLDKEPELI